MGSSFVKKEGLFFYLNDSAGIRREQNYFGGTFFFALRSL